MWMSADGNGKVAFRMDMAWFHRYTEDGSENYLLERSPFAGKRVGSGFFKTFVIKWTPVGGVLKHSKMSHFGTGGLW